MDTKYAVLAAVLVLGTAVGGYVVASDGCSPTDQAIGELAAPTDDTVHVEVRGTITSIEEFESTFLLDDGSGLAYVRPYETYRSNVDDLSEGECLEVSGRAIEPTGESRYDIVIRMGNWE